MTQTERLSYEYELDTYEIEELYPWCEGVEELYSGYGLYEDLEEMFRKFQD